MYKIKNFIILKLMLFLKKNKIKLLLSLFMVLFLNINIIYAESFDSISNGNNDNDGSNGSNLFYIIFTCINLFNLIFIYYNKKPKSLKTSVPIETVPIETVSTESVPIETLPFITEVIQNCNPNIIFIIDLFITLFYSLIFIYCFSISIISFYREYIYPNIKDRYFKFYITFEWIMTRTKYKLLNKISKKIVDLVNFIDKYFPMDK